MSLWLIRLLIVVQTNPAHITITLFFTYLLRPVPSDIQLFVVIQAVHITFTTYRNKIDVVLDVISYYMRRNI